MAAFAIDLEIAQVGSQLLLNLADLPLPTWSLSLFLPTVFSLYSLALLRRGPEARTFGKHLMGLSIRTADGARPTFKALRVRTATLAALLLVDWGALITGAMGDPRTFGRVLSITASVGIVILVIAAVRQAQTGLLTPHDAVAGTRVESYRSAMTFPFAGVVTAPARTLTVAVVAALVASLYVMGLATATGQDACPLCREIERNLARRWQMPSRVSLWYGPNVQTRDTLLVRTTVWMPLLSSHRATWGGALRYADSLTKVAALHAGLDPSRFEVVSENTQEPFAFRVHRSYPPSPKDEMVLRVGVSSPLSTFDYHLGFESAFEVIPVGPEAR